MTDTKRTEIQGLVSNGEWVHLGTVHITDEDTQNLLDSIAEIFGRGGAGWFNVGTAVFDAMKFMGVKVKQ